MRPELSNNHLVTGFQNGETHTNATGYTQFDTQLDTELDTQ